MHQGCDAENAISGLRERRMEKEKDEDEYRNREDGVREMRTPKKSSMERTKEGRRASQPTVPFDSFVHTG